MIAFLDTSALIKLYIAETGSRTLQARVEGSIPSVSQLTYGEMHAAFARRMREDLLTPKEYRNLCEDFERDWNALMRVPLSDEVLIHVPRLCQHHPLRGADALQLASAVMLQGADFEVLFVTSDRQLLVAGGSEGLEIFDPQNHAST